MSTHYSLGTVTVARGSSTVAGSGTAWQVALVTGGILVVDGYSGVIASVSSDTSLQLASPWAGPNASGASYDISRDNASASESVWANDRLAEIIARMAVTGLTPNGAGALADRPTAPADQYIYAVIESGQPIYISQYRSGSWVDGDPFQGDKGDTGSRGISAGVAFLFSTSTSMADPGTGALRLNNAALASVTSIAVDDLCGEAGNPSVASWLAGMGSSTNGVKGILTLSSRDDPSIFAIFDTSSVSSDTGWKQIGVTYLDGNGSFTNNEVVQLNYSVAGDAGVHGVNSGIPFTFNPSTTLADPGAGNFRLNHASAASATEIAVDDLCSSAGNPSVEAWLAGMGLSTNSTKGTLILVSAEDPSKFAIYKVTAVSADTGWKQISVAYQAGNGSFTSGETCQLIFERDGDAGVDGDVYATAADVAAILGADSGFQSLVAAAAGGGNQQLVSGEGVESKTYVPGGLKRIASPTNTGALRIQLPLAHTVTGQWVMFWVDIYNYSGGATCSFLIGGYLYTSGTPSWVNYAVRQVGGATRLKVQLGDDGAHRCIQIGETTDNWGYPIVRVRDISGNIGTNWTTLTTTPWVISVAATALATTFVTLYDSREAGVVDVGSASIDATTDLNSLSAKAGFFVKALSTGAPNLPAAGGWTVEQHRYTDAYGTQIAWPAWANTAAPNIRRVNAGTWAAWKALAWADDYVPKSGGTFTGTITVPALTVTGASYFGNNGTNGYLGAFTGTAASTGYLSLYLPGGTRLGYIGNAPAAGWLLLAAENGALGWRVSSDLNVTGAVTFNTTLSVTGAATFTAGFTATGACSFGSTLSLTGTLYAANLVNHLGYQAGGNVSVYLGYNRSAAGSVALNLYADNTVPTTASANLFRTAGTNGAFTITQTGTGGLNLVPGSGGLKRDGNTVLDANNRPDGTQALALAGSDTSLRTWKATDIRDASRHWARVQSDFVAVTEAGVTGNGTSDDTALIQAVIDSMTKGQVFFPPGTYLADSLIMKDNVALRGAPGGAAILKARSNSINQLTLSASAATRFNIDVADLRFDGNGKTNVTALWLDGYSSAKRISNVRLAKLQIENCNEGIHMFYCANGTIDDCFVSGVAYGVHLDMCADSDVFKTKVQNGSAIGFYIVGGAGAYDEGIRLNGCSTNGQNIGLSVVGQEWGHAIGCSFTTALGGATKFASAANWRLIGSDIACAGSPPTAVGVDIDASCSKIIVAHNTIQLNAYGVIAAGQKHSILGNQFVADENVDIYLNGATKTLVNNNLCDSTGAAWSVLEAGAADYNKAFGNMGNGAFTKVGANSVFDNNMTY